MEGNMVEPLELEKILRSEYELYNELYSFEEEKSEAIINRNGNSIESLSVEQESLLNKISQLESRRTSLVEEHKRTNSLEDISEITLKDIAAGGEDSARRLLLLGAELKRLLIRIKTLHETNQRLINDNIEFFDTLISGFKNSISVKGYSEKGNEESKVTDSLIFNQRI